VQSATRPHHFRVLVNRIRLAAYQNNTHPHPSELARKREDLERGINVDWRASLQRCPEALDYFYGLVNTDMRLPSEGDISVRDPPLLDIYKSLSRAMQGFTL